ncbi:MAG TPA: lysophospholipid acyltransferase family protein [Cellulomonas sp.]
MTADRPAGWVPSPAGPAWARWVGRFLGRVVWNTQVVGRERVPADGPVVLAANHVTLVDGPLLIGIAPRPLHILTKQELYGGPVGTVLGWAGQIPVDRANGRAALQSALGVLRRGGAIGIFPEGNRGRGAVEDVRAGAAWLAVHGAAPLVPVAMLGTRLTGESLGHIPGLRRRLYVEFGEPVAAASVGPSRARIGATSEALRSAMAALVTAAQERSGILLPADDPRRPA